MPQVNCTADCNPSCTYNWGRTRLNVLDLGLIRRADAGTHTCLARNGLGRASASIEVKVNYPPDIAFVGKQVRMEGERLQLYCRVRGVPANYTFYEWYQVSPLDNKRVQSGNMSKEGRAQLPSLSYIHNGIYYCSVSNGVPTPGGQTNITGTILNLRVNGPFHDLQAMYTKTGYAGADIKFLIDFFEFSTGQITRSWYNASSGEAVSLERGSITLENIDYQTTFFSTNVTVNGYRVITTITNLTVWDYGIYVLHLESSEQTRVVQLRVDREIATSNTTNGWLISTIILLLVLAGCGLVVGIWIYRRGNCNKGAFTRCLAIEKDRTSDEEDNVDQNNSDNQAVDASQYDPSVYTPLQIHRQHLPESPYSNLQSQSEHTYECLKTKNNSRSPVAAGGQSSNVDQESPSAMMEAASLYQNVNINTNSHHGNKETRLPPKPKPKQTKTRKKAKLPRDTEAHYNGAFKEREEM
ncbi:uncharacterized protein LOC117341188 isoform X2 [Pecten maximus]|uniref:uncharacterized protein LOC117341188 isoform X2 n=1 Tax=Pecten maximus TaxID=6579 RepID=UPI001458973A|nr:uncharacterized protein LOC117341188 isoform X2 [Pecten maximus]